MHLQELKAKSPADLLAKNMNSVEYENGITQVNSIFFKDVMRSEAWPHGKT